ncbi:MAG: NAD-dependent epimerase/dehydratase family protein [Candidatus Thorarchaeota archaeon]|jgi:nucleoside-diphosphate-sugar epimerase
MKILVTGGAGYIGSTLVPYLLNRGQQVTVLDNLLYGGEGLLGVWQHRLFRFIYGDIRGVSTVEKALDGVDAVIHLAAIVGEPACKDYHSERAKSINFSATGMMVELAKQRNIADFLFASTCSNYGKTDLAKEDSNLNPLGIYAKSKVEAEKAVLNAGYTVLRFATAFGLSPRMRFDTLVNSLSRDAATRDEISIYSPNAYRPFVHVQDLARAIWMVLLAKHYESTSGIANIFNVGGINRAKGMLGLILAELIPELEIVTNDTTEDKRDYKVDFSRIGRVGFTPQIDISTGMQEIITAIQQGIFTNPQDAKWQNT